jgi:hypothetical protein
LDRDLAQLALNLCEAADNFIRALLLISGPTLRRAGIRDRTEQSIACVPDRGHVLISVGLCVMFGHAARGIEQDDGRDNSDRSGHVLALLTVRDSTNTLDMVNSHTPVEAALGDVVDRLELVLKGAAASAGLDHDERRWIPKRLPIIASIGRSRSLRWICLKQSTTSFTRCLSARRMTRRL